MLLIIIIFIIFTGNKCKFSHDWQGGRKSVKIDIYSDPREAPGGHHTDASAAGLYIYFNLENSNLYVLF